MAKGNNTKAKIARVAWKLFHEKGYEETTIDEIILQSGTSKGSFYHYYSGKDELLASLPEIFDAKYEEVMQALVSRRWTALTFVSWALTACVPFAGWSRNFIGFSVSVH